MQTSIAKALRRANAHLHGAGCAIAQSDEAKAMGIQMGSPYYQLCDLERASSVASTRQAGHDASGWRMQQE